MRVVQCVFGMQKQTKDSELGFQDRFFCKEVMAHTQAYTGEDDGFGESFLLSDSKKKVVT